MKFIFAFLVTLFLAAPAWAVDVTMGSNGNLVFEPNDISISAGDTIHFVNGMLPPHNIIVEGRAIGHKIGAGVGHVLVVRLHIERAL